MFQTSKCSSSGRHVHAVLCFSFMHPYKQSSRGKDVFDTKHRPDCSYGFMKEIP